MRNFLASLIQALKNLNLRSSAGFVCGGVCIGLLIVGLTAAVGAYYGSAELLSEDQSFACQCDWYMTIKLEDPSGNPVFCEIGDTERAAWANVRLDGETSFSEITVQQSGEMYDGISYIHDIIADCKAYSNEPIIASVEYFIDENAYGCEDPQSIPANDSPNHDDLCKMYDVRFDSVQFKIDENGNRTNETTT
ncbi:MAG: hypothetical protein GOV15_04865, partial [Candidatus Diapherotrites archaeon]|nr:hypothetical protein [Candidatus Diapherotrites archaeon]